MKLVNNEQYNELKFMVREWHNARIYNTDYYLKLLLQYRRENNIFEVGDSVALFDNGMNDLFKISDISPLGHYWSVKCKGESYEYTFIKQQIRHATPQEIEAGRRL